MKSAYEIQEEAYAAFNAWVSAHEVECHGLDMLEQIALYAEAVSK